MINHSPYFHRLIPVLDYIQANYNQVILPKELEQISLNLGLDLENDIIRYGLILLFF